MENKRTNDNLKEKKGAESKRVRERKLNRKLAKVGLIVCIIQIIVSAVFLFYTNKLKIIPHSYMSMIALCLFLLALFFMLLQLWKITGIASTFLSVIVSSVLMIGCFYVDFTYDKLKAMSGVDTKIDNVNVYVRNEDAASTINDAQAYQFGILTGLDRDNTNAIINKIETLTGKKLSITEYESADELIKALYDNSTQAIILNDAYIGFVKGTEGYEDVESRIRVIYNMSFKTEIKTEESVPEDYLVKDENVFTILLNGVDTRGSTISNSNSDTNILMTVNMNTHQILMISTPRDYYVPLSISNGVRDKLTHSGAYGIDVTMDTLEMLYGVNVDDYVRINFDGFIDVIDALGGITVYSDYDFVGFDNDVVNMTYQFRQGYNEVNGKQALLFARERHAFASGDRQRGKNQMAVIEGIINKATSPQILKNYSGIWNEVSGCVVTSMSYDEIADFVRKQLDEGISWDIVKYSVTGLDAMSQAYSTGSAQVYVMIPDETTVSQAKEYLRQIYAGEIVVIPE